METFKVTALATLIASYATTWHNLTPGRRIHVVDFLKTKETEYAEADPERMFHNLFYPINHIRRISIPEAYTDAQFIKALEILVNVLTDIDDKLNTDQELTWAENWFSDTITWAEVDILCQDLEF